MTTVSRQIKQYLAQPDLNASRRKALSYLNDNHASSQSTSSLEDAVREIRHERDNLQVSVRSTTHLPGHYLSTFRSSDGRFELEHSETEV
jgi:hypothetical protein